MYTLGTFHRVEIKYPSSHKEFLAGKLSITRFRLFLKPVKFIIKIYLKHIPVMLKHEKLLEQGNDRI
jgi:hypothetical protein